MEIQTADLCDQFIDRIKVANSLAFKSYGKKKNFYGEIVTIQCYENNPLVRKALEKDGMNKVLIVDGGASLRCALMGDNIGALAVKNKWNGVIINGCIRDSAAINQLALGVRALHTNPQKSGKNTDGKENIPLTFAGIEFKPGEWVYVDEDGIVVSTEKLVL